MENHEFLLCGDTPIGGVFPSSEPVLVNPGRVGDGPPIGIGFAVVLDVVVEDVVCCVLDGAMNMSVLKPLAVVGADAGANSGVEVPFEAAWGMSSVCCDNVFEREALLPSLSLGFPCVIQLTSTPWMCSILGNDSGPTVDMWAKCVKGN